MLISHGGMGLLCLLDRKMENDKHVLQQNLFSPFMFDLVRTVLWSCVGSITQQGAAKGRLNKSFWPLPSNILEPP